MKRLLLWLVSGLVIILVLLSTSLNVYSQTDAFRSWAREKLLDLFRSSINGELNVERIGGSWVRGLTFHNLSIHYNGDEVLLVPQGSLTFDLLPQLLSLLRSSTFRIDSLTLSAPTLRLIQDPQHGWTIQQLFKTPEQPTEDGEPSHVSIFLDRIGVSDGRIEVQPVAQEPVQLTTLSLAGELTVVPAGVQATLGTLSFSVVRPGLPELRWSGGVAYNGAQTPALLSFRHVDLHTAHSHLQISGIVRDFSVPKVALTAEVEQLAVADLHTVAPTVPLQQDISSGTIRATGPLSALHVVASVQLPDGRAHSEFTADLAQTPQRYEGTLEVTNLAVPQAVQVENASGIVTGRTSFTVIGGELQHGTFDTQIANLQVQEQVIGDVTTKGTVQNQQVSLVGETHGRLGDTHWQGQLTLGQPLTYDLTLAVRNLALARVTPQPPPVPATLNFNAQVAGSGTTLAELDSTVQVTLLPSQLGEITDTQGKLVGTVQNGQITVKTLSLTAKDTTVTAQGTIGGLQETPGGTLTYHVRAEDLAPWLALIGRQGSGALRAQGTAQGTLASLQVEGTTTLTDFHVADTALQKATATYTLTGLGGPEPRGQASATLTQLDAGLEWRTVTLEASLTEAAPVTIATTVTAQDSAGRTQQISGQVRYAPEQIEAILQNITLQLPTGTWQSPQPARVQLHEQKFTFENLQLQNNQQAVSVQGTLALQGAQDLNVQLTRIPLSDVRTLFGTQAEATPLDVTGRVSATVNVQGTAAQPTLAANLTTSALTVEGLSYAGLTAQLTYQGPQLQLAAELRQDPSHVVSITGGVPLALSWVGGSPTSRFGEADFRVQSAGLSLAFLNLFTTEDIQEIRGTLGMDVRLQGPLTALTPLGTVQLENGHARVAPLGVELRRITAEVQLSADAVRISTLRARSGNGMLMGSGTVGLQQYAVTTLDLALRADEFQVINTHPYKAALSGQLAGLGSWEQPVVRGALTVTETALRPEITLLNSGPPPPDPTITVVQSAADLVPAPPEAAPGATPSGAVPEDTEQDNGAADTLYNRLALDVGVTIPRDTWIHLDNGSVEIMGQVRARKEAYEPFLLSGTIDSVRGWYSVYGRKFRLERGQIRFTGTTPIDPVLDVVAQYTLSQYEVEVVVSGTARSPSLALRSEPALEQADILSLLVFGRTTDGLNQGEKASLQSQVLQTAVGYIASDLRRSLAEELGVDNLELDVGNTLDQSRIGAGTYLTEGVFISTSQYLGDKNQREFAIEYQLTRNWQIRAITTIRGNDGIDILWQRRY